MGNSLAVIGMARIEGWLKGEDQVSLAGGRGLLIRERLPANVVGAVA